MAEIIAVLEGPIALTECSTDISGLCDLEPYCPIKDNQRIISQAVRGALEKVMLSDLSQPLHMRLYAACPYYVPPLLAIEYQTFSREKNPAFETADSKLYLAREGSAIVGRVAAIVNHAWNDAFNRKEVFFGWFDTVNDIRVTTALFAAVENWGARWG